MAATATIVLRIVHRQASGTDAPALGRGLIPVRCLPAPDRCALLPNDEGVRGARRPGGSQRIVNVDPLARCKRKGHLRGTGRLDFNAAVVRERLRNSLRLANGGPDTEVDVLRLPR